MRLSTKGRYGLRALLDVAVYSEEEPVSIRSIAQRQNISEAYLEQLMPKLKKAGLIDSQRGASGGYRLTRPAEEISVGEVLRALEGELDAVNCPGLKEADSEEEGCCEAHTCVTKYVWQKINDSITKTVDEISLSILVEQSRQIHEESSANVSGKRACC